MSDSIEDVEIDKPLNRNGKYELDGEQLSAEALIARVITAHLASLVRTVRFRLDPRLRARLDPEDVIQEVFLEASKRIDYLKGNTAQDAIIWIRMILFQVMTDLHRRHIGAAKRSAASECKVRAVGDDGGETEGNDLFAGKIDQPFVNIARKEDAIALREAINSLSDIDQQIITLRHIEELTNAEAAQIIGMSEQAASARYVRAFKRLKAAVKSSDGVCILPLERIPEDVDSEQRGIQLIA